jgi:hypothetical protein
LPGVRKSEVFYSLIFFEQNQAKSLVLFSTHIKITRFMYFVGIYVNQKHTLNETLNTRLQQLNFWLAPAGWRRAAT